MAENSAKEDATPPQAVKSDSVNKDSDTKPLRMSFADWKKSREPKEQPGDAQATRNSRKTNKIDNRTQGNNRIYNNNHNNINNINNSYPPLSRPPPLPFPLMSMGFGNFGHGHGPGPCGPPPMMPSGCNMSNMGNMGNMGPGPGPGPRNHRPLQPPPFWEDMMSPQHRPPPIQPPMPKCPSSWNLVPRDKQRQNKQNQNQNSQPNKKYKANTNNKNNNSNNNSSNNNNNSTTNNALLDAALMPPPPPPPPPGGSCNSSNNSSNNSSTSNKIVKKKKCGGTFVQIDGKWIQRPEAPPPLEEAPPGTKEERQRQWREYRQAMKPFKNREFHNWKRTVQRLSKLPRDQLDERQLERLRKAEEYIGAHKAMLTIKHAEHWVQQTNRKIEAAGGNGQAQVYVRKPVNPTWQKNNDQSTLHQGPPPVRKQVFGTGRAIKGGIGGDMGSIPNNPTRPIVGQLPTQSGPPIGGNSGYFGYNSHPYVQDTDSNNSSGIGSGANSSVTNSFYASYTNSFTKGGTLLPP
ncbi:transcription factor mef2A isoform X3 [Drosophila navojoa]|uniref:transcription factor mef2A isoform X3 n=1 Tax=Drosophila navojoa TaxID=7232 RepID=UPI0011BE14B3|nr:transcription factor mef2A isoform X3 [Drosophila navojoa]